MRIEWLAHGVRAGRPRFTTGSGARGLRAGEGARPKESDL